MATMSEAAVKGLDIATGRGVMRVRDGEDTWLCWQSEWERAVVKLATQDAVEGEDAEAYTALCSAVRGPVAALNGTSRGNIGGLLDAAFAAELIDEDMLHAMVQS